MSLSAVNVGRLLVVLMLLGELPVDAEPLSTSCLRGYFNAFRCMPVISWFATFIIQSCDLKCKATGKYNHGTCNRTPIPCIIGTRSLYVCDCKGQEDEDETGNS